MSSSSNQRPRSACAFGLALGLLACSAPEPAGGKTPPRAKPMASVRPTQAPPQAQRLEQEVTWPEASAVDGATRAALTDEARAAVDRAPVPALVVARPELLARSVIMAKEHWYAVSASHDGLTVSIHASRVAHRYPHTPKAQGRGRVRGHHAFVTQNEGIWSAAWVEGGVAYALEVECGQRPDARCDDEALVLSLAGDLRYVGGRASGVSR